MTIKILILQHVSWRNPGRLLLDLSEKLSVKMYVVKGQQEPIPKGIDFDALILLGGDTCGNRGGSLLFVDEEKQFLADWLTHEKPCLSFCLGHGPLMETFQAKVIDNSVNSVGFIEGHLTHDGRLHPLFQGIPPTFMLFKWHNQSVQTPIPRDLVLLATSSDCVVEAFTIKGRPYIVGLQFDNHAAHPADVSEWLDNDGEWLKIIFFEDEFKKKLIKEATSNFRTNEQIFNKLIENFITITKCSK